MKGWLCGRVEARELVALQQPEGILVERHDVVSLVHSGGQPAVGQVVGDEVVLKAQLARSYRSPTRAGMCTPGASNRASGKRTASAHRCRPNEDLRVHDEPQDVRGDHALQRKRYRPACLPQGPIPATRAQLCGASGRCARRRRGR